jgi:thioredoxin reductase (NADPH)
MPNKKVDVLVIGSGPAGNTAGIYTVRAGLKTTLITGLTTGGQLTTTTEVANFPGFPEPIQGYELMDRTIQQSKNLGIDVVNDVVSEVNFKKRPFICKTENGKIYEANNVIIATGAKARWLGIPSEEKFKGFGVSGCAICDGNFYKNQDVMVVGGGKSAGVEALHMSHLAKKVYLVHRRDTFRMEADMEKEIKANKKIEIIYNSQVEEILGTEKPKGVTSVKIKNLKNEKVKEIKLSGIFVSIGKVPDTEIFKNSGLEIDERGYIITKSDSTITNIKGVFACGDVTNKPHKQAIVAAGYGCIASLEIEN